MDDSDHAIFYQQLGANIRAHRKALKLSQDSLGKMVGLTRTSLTNIENGRQHPPLHTFCEIVEQLKVGVTDLLPARKPAPAAVDANAIAAPQVRDQSELAFIVSGIGLKQEENVNGDKKKKNRSARTGASVGSADHRSAGSGVQNRQVKRSAHPR
jgi:transcriptional regulator with XRE-family HTH domain